MNRPIDPSNRAHPPPSLGSPEAAVVLEEAPNLRFVRRMSLAKTTKERVS